MSSDKSRNRDPFTFDFEESLKEMRKKIERTQKKVEKEREQHRKAWEETNEKFEEIMDNYSIFDPVDFGEFSFTRDFDTYDGRNRGYTRESDMKTYGERERFYDFVDNDLDMSEFKNYTD